MKQRTFFQQVVAEMVEIMGHHLLNQRQFGHLRLQNHTPLPTLSPRTSAHLCHHRESMLIGTEVRIVQHRVGIQDAHHLHMVEIKPFTNHLRADEDIRFALRKIANQSLIGVLRARGV